MKDSLFILVATIVVLNGCSLSDLSLERKSGCRAECECIPYSRTTVDIK